MVRREIISTNLRFSNLDQPRQAMQAFIGLKP